MTVDAQTTKIMNWPWQIDFKAARQKDFLRLDEEFPTRGSKTHANERGALIWLLKALYKADNLSFPLVVSHLENGQDPPDFQLRLNDTRVAVEARAVASEQMQHARALPKNGRTLLLGGDLLRKRKSTRTEFRQTAFIVPQFPNPLSVQEWETLWCDEFKRAIEEKSKILKRPNFVHGNEDWLILRDEISYPTEFSDRETFAAEHLQALWKDRWFTRVFLDQPDCGFLFEFKESGVRRLVCG